MHEIEDIGANERPDDEAVIDELAAELYDAARAGEPPPGVYGGFLSGVLLAKLKGLALEEARELLRYLKGRLEQRSGGGGIFGGGKPAE